MTFEKISVVGLGYIGLPTAAVIASRGVQVIGVDVNQRAVDTINRGEIHITEPALDAVVGKAVESGLLRATTAPEPADAFLIAVPTPMTADHKADLSYVAAAGAAIAPVLKRGDLVILESTSPVGTTEELCRRLAAARSDLRFPVRGEDGIPDVHVAYCPERVLPGKVIEELVSNDRAIGGVTASCTAAATALYRIFVEGELLPTDVRSAELCKLAENAYRDVNIAYANELANVCGGLDIDVWEVIRLANRHPRVEILRPGPGVGGHCIAIDPWFIAEAAPKDTPLIQAARAVNDGRPHRVLDQVASLAQGFRNEASRAPAIAFLGLAFKPNIDDTRESPAIEVVQLAAAAGLGAILAVEPNIDALPDSLASDEVELVELRDAMNRADIVVLLVDHSEFVTLDPGAFAGKRVLDTRGRLAAL